MYFPYFISRPPESSVRPCEVYLITQMNHFYIQYLYLVRRGLNRQVNFIFFASFSSSKIPYFDSIIRAGQRNFFAIAPLHHKSRVDYIYMSVRQSIFTLLPPIYRCLFVLIFAMRRALLTFYSFIIR